MADENVVNLRINALVDKAKSQLAGFNKEFEKIIKTSGLNKQAIESQTNALDKHIKSLQKTLDEELKLDARTQKRIDRINALNKSLNDQLEKENELNTKIDEQRKTVEKAERAYLENSKAYQDNVQDKIDAEERFNVERERLLKLQQQQEKDALRQAEDNAMARARIEQESNRQIQQIRENVARAQSRDSDLSLSGVDRPSVAQRRAIFESQTRRDSPINERAIAAARSGLDKLTGSWNKLRGAMARTKLAAEDNDTLLGKIALSADETSAASRRLELRLGRLGRTLLGLGIAGVIIFMQSFTSSLVAVGAQAIAVVGSIGAAAGAIGGTLVSAIATAVPMLGVLGAALSRLSVIGEAIGQFDLTQKQGFGPEDATQDEQTAKDNADAIADAQRNQRQATEDLTQARKEAKDELEDLIAAEKEAELAMRSATLTQKEARQELQDAIQEGDVGGIDRAQLAVDEARLGVNSARTDLSRARRDAQKARQGGVENMPQVIDATRQLADANRALADSHEQAATAANEQSAAEQYLQYYLSQLSDAELELYHAVIDFRERLKKVAEDISEPIIRSFTYAIKKSEDLVFNNKILDGMQRLSRGMAGSIKNLTDVVTSDASIRFWTKMIEEARKNLAPIEDILKNVYRLFRNIAEGAAPVFHRLLKLIADETENWVDATKDADEVEEFFQNGLKHLRAWGRLLKGVIDLFSALMEVSGHSAIKTLDDLTKRLHEGAEGLRDNSKEARHFFDQTSKATGYLIDIITEFGKELVRSFNPKAVKALRDILVNVIIPALGEAIRLTGKFAIVLDKAFQGPLGTIVKWAIAFKLIYGSAKLLFDLMLAALSPLRNVATGILFAIEALGISIGGATLVMIGIGAAIAVVVAGIAFLLYKLGVLDDVFNWLKQAASDVGQYLADQLGEPLSDLGDAFASLASTIRDRFENIVDIIGAVVKFFIKVFGSRKGSLSGPLLIFRNVFEGVFEFVKGILKGFLEFFIDSFKNFLKIFGGVIKVIDGVLSGDLGKVWDGITDIIEGTLNQVLNLLDTFTQPFEEAAKLLAKAFTGPWETIKDTIDDVFDSILGTIADFLGIAADALSKVDFLPGVSEQVEGLREAESFLNDLKNDDGPAVDKDTKKYVENSKKVDENRLAVDRLNDTLIRHGQESKIIEDATGRRTKATEKNTDKTKDNRKEVDNFTDAINKGTKGSKFFEKQTKDTGKEQDNQSKATKNLQRRLGNLKGTLFGSGKQSENLGETIKNVTNNILKEFGVDELKFSIPKTAKIVQDAISTVTGGAFQSGGYFGNPSMRGPDDRYVKVAGGEAMLTGHHQDAANAGLAVGKAMGVTPYGSLAEMFAKDRRPHATAPKPKGRYEQRGKTAFATGGSVSLLGAHQAVSSFVSALMKKFGGSVGSGLRAGDSGSLHSTGQAIDYSPSDWVGASKSVNRVGPSLLEGIYNPAVEGGSPVSWDEGQHVDSSFWGSEWGNHLDHIHIAIADGAKISKKGFAALGAAGMSANIPRIKVKGPDGPLKDALQGQADKLRDAAQKKVGKYGGAGMDVVGKGAKVKNLPKSLAQYNRIFEEHNSGEGDWGGYVMPKPAIAALAEWAGTPGWTMEYITRGESGGRPGATGIDPGGTKGLGLWMITTGYNDPLIAKLGGEANMRNPILNAIAMKSIYDGQGLGAWYAAHPADTNQHYTGKLLSKQRGGMIPEFDEGGVVPGPRGKKRLVFAHGGETFVPTHKEEYQRGGPVQQAFKAIEELFETFERPSGIVSTGKEDENWRKDYKEKVLKTVEDLLRDGGALDDLMTAIEEQIVQLDNNLQDWQLKVKRGRVVNIRTFRAISVRTLKNLKKIGSAYEEEANDLEEAMKVIEKRIRGAKDVDERQKFRAALENLKNRYDELNATINENLSARLEQQAAIFEAEIARFDQLKGFVDSRRQIMELRAEIAGRDLTGDQYLQTFRDTGRLLRRERRDIRQELRSARRGGDLERARELRQSMLDNRIAILENTQALKEAKDAVQETFSFNTTAWQLYRQAVLNGSGGLVPQSGATIPSLAVGGMVTTSGLFNLHAGEAVTPAPNVGDTNLYITEPMEVADPEAVSSAIAWKLKTAT